MVFFEFFPPTFHTFLLKEEYGELHQTKLCSTDLSQHHSMLTQGCNLFHLLSLHTGKQTKYTKGTWKSLTAVQTGQIF